MNHHNPKILAFAGSLRKGSFNKKLVKIAVEGAREAGADVTLIDLADFPMPIYDGDLEQEKGMPPNALRLKNLMLENNGLLIASPEYNSSISAVLKNAIDWVSRPQPNEEDLIVFKNKVACIMSASPGYFGGIRGLVHLRSILGNIRVLVLPNQIFIPNAHKAFDENDQLIDSKKQSQTKEQGTLLAQAVRKHSLELSDSPLKL